jgi:hypothetical protein
VQPGSADTGLYRQMPPPFRLMATLFYEPPAQAAQSVVQLAMDPELTAVTGQYFDRTTVSRAADHAYDEEVQARLMYKCQELTNLTQGKIPV